MSKEDPNLRERVSEIGDNLEKTLKRGSETVDYVLREGRVIFERSVLAEHRKFRVGLAAFVKSLRIRNIFIAPVIYAMVVPLAFLDLSLAIYQRICFPAWGLALVRRRDYVVIDRQKLAYLNGMEKFNCIYCGYANGVIALAREIAGRTEHYWCPIKHAQNGREQHDYAQEFLEYGDAQGWRSLQDEQTGKRS